MDSTLEEELIAARAGAEEDRQTEAGVVFELSLRETLTDQKKLEVEAQSAIADKFYGVDPLSLTAEQQMTKVIERMSSIEQLGDVHKFAQLSHEAAYKRRFATEALTRLEAQSAALQARLVEIRALDAARATELEAQRLKDEAERQQIAANIFSASGSAAVSQAQIISAAGTLSLAEGAALTLQTAIRAAIAELGSFAAATASGFFVGVAALVYSPKLGNGELPERYAVSLPLSDLGPMPDGDLHALAAAGGTADMAVRLGTRSADDSRSEVIVIPTDGATFLSPVRVVAATFNAEQKVYSVSTADTPPRTLTWTPIVKPGDSSTELPVEAPAIPVYEGATVTPIEGRIDVYPELADAAIDDYIFVFPADSGLPPLYVVFKDARSIPGMSNGVGAPISGRLLDPLSPDSALIPEQIAAQLTGREFSSFNKLREAIWKALAADPVLGSQFTAYDLANMRVGRAPKVHISQESGSRKVYELHHKLYISKGGDVYGLDNLQIVTPKQHLAIHKLGD